MVSKPDTKNRIAGVADEAGDQGILNVNAIRVLENRYLKKDENGHIVETPRQMFERVATHVAAVETKPEQWSSKYFDLMWSGKFIPNSPTMMNAGRPLGMLSACFVLPLEDSIPDIMETARQIALVQRAGGGTGIDLSKLRPKGSIVRSSGGTTEGPLSFLRMLSGVTNAIQQGAFRRGANMGTLRIDHPDILDFVRVKEDLSQVTNYNLSVTMTDSFMEQYRAEPNALHIVVNPATGRRAYLRRENGSADYETFDRGISANEKEKLWTVGQLFDLIIEKAWLSGEPGLIFIDRVNEYNQTPNVGPMCTTNPCGEQPLLPYEACNLGSLNLASFVRADKTIDWDGMKEAIHLSIRFLDDVVEANNYPTREIDEMCRANRKIGLGVMGWADMLFMLDIPYNSEEALALARKVGGFIQKEGWDADTVIAEEKGVFANWKGSVWDTKFHRKMRNAHCVTVAPTGTISIIAGCSGGIEPIFSLSFVRQVMNGQTLYESNPVFKKRLEDQGYDQSTIDRILNIACTEGTVQNAADLEATVRKTFVTARDIDPKWHVKMQAAWQEFTDAAVSKTINFPAEATPEEVKEAYLLAFETRCKGITVYRDGSRQNQPMALKTDKSMKGGTASSDKAPTTTATESGKIEIAPVKLPELMPGVRIRQITPFGNMHVKLSVDPKTGVEREIFAQLGKGGDVATSDLEAICRMMSLFLRCNGPIELALNQLEGIGSSLSVPSADGSVTSLADGLAKAIQKYLRVKRKFGLKAILLGEADLSAVDDPNATAASIANDPLHQHSRMSQTAFKVKCPECKGVLSFEEGCVKCPSCGYSQC
ncbi:MAG: adenosylcobalamin-dependent ribonucleoside-diphosphate reductase [Planctomycetes bacterium]|nr:adenosylcobalamin-dependent ribonucleoside-diphosphate reductase [Planctomycetota bacterium]MCC7169140.1 adenosylcobalamin-dependent ribonucleoside-diphosphate reductase [Planctomycetota bacterium]